MISFAIDPFKLLFEAINKLYPKLEVEVFFVPTDIIVEILKDNDSKAEAADGVTLVSTDGNAVVYINSDMPASDTVEAIANEVASVITDGDEELAELELDKIQKAYGDLIDAETFKLEKKLIEQH